MHLNATKRCSVPNQVVKCQCLLGKCMFSGWTNIVSLHRVASCERLHRPGPSETALLVRLTWFLTWEIMFFNAVYIQVGFPMQWAGHLLWHSEYEKSQRQLLKVLKLIWVDGQIRVVLGEQKADGSSNFGHSCLSMMYMTENTAG